MLLVRLTMAERPYVLPVNFFAIQTLSSQTTNLPSPVQSIQVVGPVLDVSCSERDGQAELTRVVD